jgi:phosphotransferase system IIB component
VDEYLTEVFVKEIQEAFGGFENIRYVNVKFTRFEFRIVDETKVKQELLNRISDVNFIQLNANDYQIITFNKAKYLKEAWIKDFGKKVI